MIGLSFEFFNATIGRYLSDEDKAKCFHSNRTILELSAGRKVIIEDSHYPGDISACKKLIDIGYPVRMPSDYLTGIIAYNKLKVFCAYPLTDFSQQRKCPPSDGHKGNLRSEHGLIRV